MTIVWIIVLVFVVVAAVTTAWAGWRAAPFVPTRSKDVERMLDLAELKDGEVVYDLGAGDGRLLLAATQRQAQVTAVGFELSLLFYLIGWLRILLSPNRQRMRWKFQDFFHHSISEADVVVCFLTPPAMSKLEPKFRQELRPGARIISAVFPMPNWKPDLVDKPTGRVSVYRYRVGNRV